MYARHLLNRFLPSCPDLESFDLQGDIDVTEDGGAITLDFTSLANIKSINIDIIGVDDYKLFVPGSYHYSWLDMEIPYTVLEEDNDVEQSFYIKLMVIPLLCLFPLLLIILISSL